MKTPLETTNKEDVGTINTSSSLPVIESEIGQTDTKLEGQEDPLNWSPLSRCKSPVWDVDTDGQSKENIN